MSYHSYRLTSLHREMLLSLSVPLYIYLSLYLYLECLSVSFSIRDA